MFLNKFQIKKEKLSALANPAKVFAKCLHQWAVFVQNQNH